MIKCDYLIPARGFAVDRFTDACSIFEVLDELKPVGFPAMLPKLVVVAIFTREGGDASELRPRLSLRLEGNVLIEDHFDVKFGEGFRARSFVVLQGIPFLHHGTVSIRAEHEGTLLGQAQMVLRPAATALFAEEAVVASTTKGVTASEGNTASSSGTDKADHSKAAG